MKVVLAEKPSVARDIARVLGASQKKDGWIEGNGYQITWAFGHLIGIVEPSVMSKDWGGKWSFRQLPMIPENFQLTTNESSVKQYKTIAHLFDGCEEIINATDAGREGELIFRWIYRHASCEKPFKRLWISDLTDASIKQGFSELYPGTDFDCLGQSAQCRAFADWIVGLNATRAYSVRNNELCTVGRVQTPTLALIVDRQKLIEGFEKCFYYELYANAKNIPFRWEDAEGYKIEKKEKALALEEKLKGRPGTITEVKKSKRNTSPSPLYDLTLLQKECNEKFGYTAQETLTHAQALYEKHKLISYPRTESRHLSEKIRPELPEILRNAPDNLQQDAEVALARIKAGHKLGKNYINDKKLTDHHAIIPTKKKLTGKLSSELENVYMLVQKRFISVFYPNFTENITEITLEIDKENFKFKGAYPTELGWRAVYLSKSEPTATEIDSKENWSNDPVLNQYPLRADVVTMLKAQFKKGQTLEIESLEVKEKETLPPKPFTDGTLLNAMRYIGRQVDDDELAAQLKDQGLGTQATRAMIIERLLKSKYIIRKGKTLIPTPKGIKLIDNMIPELKSPEMTAEWEQKLSQIQDGELKDNDFMSEINSFTEKVINVIKQAPVSEGRSSLGTCPQCQKGQIYPGKKSYYCSRYREGCKFILWDTIASKKLEPEQVKKIIANKQSDWIEGFISKKGTPFTAIIKLDKDFKTIFSFDKNPSTLRK